HFEGEAYLWSKHAEFLKFVNVPRRAAPAFQLALASYEPADRALLEERGWTVRDAAEFSYDLDGYRSYISRSRAEFTVAKDQNVRFRSGWFSDRSATYLAAGRPVITQDTGFGNVLPVGEGLFAFSTMEEILESIRLIEDDYPRARKAARAVAAGFFAHDVVLPDLLSRLGLAPKPSAPYRSSAEDAFDVGRPIDAGSFDAVLEPLVLEPTSRRPLRLPEETIRGVMSRPLPVRSRTGRRGTGEPSRNGTSDSGGPLPEFSLIVVTFGALALTRLCLESALARAAGHSVEILVVDNASTDGTPDYLESLAASDPRISPILLPENRGFPAACNAGLERARGEILILLNNDTILPPEWLERLRAPLLDPRVGGVNPVTNRIGTEAEVSTAYRTYGGWLREARRRARDHRGRTREVEMLALFCLAVRRTVYERIGPLDEGFGLGLFEDDDYSARLRDAGFRLMCAEDVLVHHFGEASFGELVPRGEYGDLFRANRARFEGKWEREWTTHSRRTPLRYVRVVEEARRLVSDLVPEGATVAVVSRGDEELVAFSGRTGWHFPRQGDGTYAGHYPADGPAAVAQVEALHGAGADYLLIPEPAFWWLEYYEELERHLARHCAEVARTDGGLLFRLAGTEPVPAGAEGTPPGGGIA
ncbi:MAG: glycosyltransferase family 2 protein, partial [Gemmatimonadota bacterium]|nr:glycosyltransferase family 2 protein [Gemmatimonadota bacterium]